MHFPVINHASTSYPSQSDINGDKRMHPFDMLAKGFGCVHPCQGWLRSGKLVISFSCTRFFTLHSQFRLPVIVKSFIYVYCDLDRTPNSVCHVPFFWDTNLFIYSPDSSLLNIHDGDSGIASPTTLQGEWSDCISIWSRGSLKWVMQHEANHLSGVIRSAKVNLFDLCNQVESVLPTKATCRNDMNPGCNHARLHVPTCKHEASVPYSPSYIS